MVFAVYMVAGLPMLFKTAFLGCASKLKVILPSMSLLDPDLIFAALLLCYIMTQ